MRTRDVGRIPCGWLVAASLALAGCGDDPLKPARATTRVGPAGGEVVTDDLTLTIPAGALDETIEIYVSRLDEDPPGFVDARSPLFAFAPNGLRFAEPAELSIAFAGEAEDLALYWSSDGLAYLELAGEVRGRRLVAEVDHFSRGFVGDAGDCEADLDTDPDHCGRCGNACEGDAACVAGECQLACEALTADCDGDPEDGCETALTSESDCGGCGFECDPMATCEADDTTATCVCSTGTEGDGATCDEIDGCIGDPCPDGVACMDLIAPATGFACGDCPAGTEEVDDACVEIDGCAGDPCFAGVLCTDVAAPGTGFTCGACPAGTEGDGETCDDIDGCIGVDCAVGEHCVDVAAPGTGHACVADA
jgi:hypothetical protein